MEHYTIIEKKYTFPETCRFATIITYDLPIHIAIRFDFNHNVAADRIGHDDNIDLDKTRVGLTISSNNGRVLVANHELGLVYYEPKGFPSRWDTVTLRVHIRTKKSESVSPIVIDFKNEKTFHDRILVVGGEKFYVNSGLLSAWSDYFLTLFNGQFLEKDSNEITLKDVVAENFEELLKVIYPTRMEISKDNVVAIWKLADRFVMPSVAQMCEQFLTSSPGKYLVSLSEKSELALFVKSDKLMDDCMILMAKMNLGN